MGIASVWTLREVTRETPGKHVDMTLDAPIVYRSVLCRKEVH